ncbi:MAG TPA: hypothetical protein PK156_17200, partial [Polyangium sp.]|nr:hypothetical protein [Polyangium sp.]
LRDARDLYEVEIRDGRPMRATRTTADGSYERGPGVLARLLGVGSGRFVVVPIANEDVERLSAARPDLFGTLSEQLVPLVAAARAAQRLLSGSSLMQATRIELDMGILRPLGEAMPDRARSVIKAIADGSSPRDLVMSGSAPARLVEDVLCDAAAHGAISAIVGASGTDLLTPAVQIESDRLRGVRRLAPVIVPPLSDVLPEPDVVSPSPQPVSAVIDRSATPAPVVRDELSSKAPIVETNAKKTRVSLVDDKPRETMRAAQTPAVLVAPNDDDDDATTLALMDKSPVANVAVEQAEDFTPDIISGVQTYLPPPVAPVGQVEAASAKPSLAKETAKETAKEAVKEKSQPTAKATFRDTPILGSKVSLKLPVPEPEHDLGQETIKDNLEVAPEFTESLKVAVVPTQRASILPPPPPQTRAPLDALTPSRKPPMEVTPGMSSPIAAKLSTPASPKPVVAKPVSPKPVAVKPNSPKPPIVAKPKPAPLSSLGSLEPPPVEDLSPLRATLPSTHAPRPRVSEATVRASSPAVEPPKRDNSTVRVGAWILFALAGVAFAVGSRVSQQRNMQAQAPVEQVQQQQAVAPVETAAPAAAPEPAAEVAPPAPTSLDRKAGETADFPILPQDSPLRSEDKVPKGQGLLEVIAGPTDSIFVDGQLIGTGPVVKVPLAPKKDPYEIRLRLRGEERVRFALVKEGRMSRIRIAPPWSR